MDNFRDSYYKVSWDLATNPLQGIYWGKQYDTGRGFVVTVINGDQVVTATNEVLRLKWEKPDNTTGYVKATIVNGKFIIENIDQMFTVQGSVRADFELSVGGKFVASTTFHVNVEKAVAVDSIESSSDFTALQDALADVDGMQAQVNAVGARLDSTDAQLNDIEQDFTQHKLDYAEEVGTVANLTTTSKEVVGAVNELDALKADLSEIEAARGTEPTLGARLDSTDAQLNDIEQDFTQHKLDYEELEGVNDGAVTPEKTSFISSSKNLFNKNTASIGNIIIETSGNLGISNNFTVSDFIKVTAGLQYVYTDNSSVRVVFFDANKSYLSGIKSATKPITVPEGAEYLRFHFATTNKNQAVIDAMQFEEGIVSTNYEPYDIYYLDKSIIANDGNETTHLTGKSIVFFGDSITGAYALGTGYPATVEKMLGNISYNCGFSGSRMTTLNTLENRDPYSMVQIVNAIDTGDWTAQEANKAIDNNITEKLGVLRGVDFNNVDIATIFYGTNDFTGGIDIDNENDKLDVTTFCGAARYSVKKLLEKYPHLKIVLISVTWRTLFTGGYPETETNSKGVYLHEYVTALKDVATEFHIPFIDMYNDLGLNKYNYELYTFDGLHPNPDGRVMIGNRIASQLQLMV